MGRLPLAFIWHSSLYCKAGRDLVHRFGLQSFDAHADRTFHDKGRGCDSQHLDHEVAGKRFRVTSK